MTAEEKPTGSHEGAADKPYEPKGGEDEGSAEQDGNDEHLHEDQKPITK